MELGKEVQRQSVIIILSAPIDFDAIRSQSLPLARLDVNTNESDDVIRVSSRTAVKIASRPTTRSRNGMPKSAPQKNNQSARADRNANEVLRKIDRKGSSNVPEMNFVIETLKAKEHGKPFHGTEIDLWSPQLGVDEFPTLILPGVGSVVGTRLVPASYY